MEVLELLVVGARVTLHSLVSRQDVNGREAELLSGPHHENRWAVRIITTGECIRVKPANFHRSPGLHTHLNSDAIALVFRQCCGRSLRALCATDQAISALAKAALLAGEWRRRIDAERLKEWKASSPVYGFFSLEGSQDRSGLCMSRSTTGDLVANSFVDTLQEVSWRYVVGVSLFDARRGVRLGMHSERTSRCWDEDEVLRPLTSVVALSADGRRLALGCDNDEKYDGVQLFEIIRDGDSCTFTPRGTTGQGERGDLLSMAWSTGPQVAGGLDQPHFLLCSHAPSTNGGKEWTGSVEGLSDQGTLRLWRVEANGSDEWRRTKSQELRFGTDIRPYRTEVKIAGWSAFTPSIADGDGDDAQAGCDFAAADGDHSKILLLSVPFGNGEASWRRLQTRHRGGIVGVALMPPTGPGRRGMRVVCAGAMDTMRSQQIVTVWSVDTGACIGALNYRAAIRAMPWFNSLGRYERENYGMPGPADPRGAAPEDGLQDLSDEEEQIAYSEELRANSPIKRHTLSSIDVSGAGMLVTGDRAGCLCVWDLRAAVESSPSPGGEDRRFAEIEEEGEELNAEGGFAGRPSNILLVAVNPPGGDSVPGNDSSLDEARLGHGTVLDYIYGVAIVETDGEDVAGGGIVFGQNPYPTDGGRCKWTSFLKIRPVDKTDMLNLG